MAKAFVTGVEQAFLENGASKIQVGVVFAGADVTGSIQKVGLIVDLSSVSVVSDIQTLIAAAVRNYATQRGWTVGASAVYLQSYTTA